MEKKVRQQVAVLEKADMRYRPAIGFQAARLVAAIPGPAYGSTGKCDSEYAPLAMNNLDSQLTVNAFPASTPLTPASVERFHKKYERRSVAYSKIDIIEAPEEILAFDSREAYLQPNGIHPASGQIKVSA